MSASGSSSSSSASASSVALGLQNVTGYSQCESDCTVERRFAIPAGLQYSQLRKMLITLGG